MRKANLYLFVSILAALFSGICLAGETPMQLERPDATQRSMELGKPEGEPAVAKPIPPIKEPGVLNLFPLNAHELNSKKIEALNTATKRVYIMDVSLSRSVEEDKNRLLQTINMALERKVDVKILVRYLESKEEMELYQKGVVRFLRLAKDSMGEYEGEMVIVRDGKELVGSRGWLYKRINTSTWQIDIREMEEIFRKAWQ